MVAFVTDLDSFFRVEGILFMKKFFVLAAALMFFAAVVPAQFPIKLPQPKRPDTPAVSGNNDKSSNRQMVMDDGFTFFIAEPVKGRNPTNTGDIDVGWRLKPTLRLMGTFPDNSGFRVALKKSGKLVSEFKCTAWVFRKADDIGLRASKVSGAFDDFMQTRECDNAASPVKEIGQFEVEIYFDGDGPKLLRKHQIDVRKTQNILGFPPKTYSGVSEYYIPRYAETSVGIMHYGGGSYLYGSSISTKPFGISNTGSFGMELFLPYAPDKRTYYKSSLACSCNGAPVTIARPDFQVNRDSSAPYFLQSALMERREPKYTERITFAFLKVFLPLSVGEVPLKTNVSKLPGKWECALSENGAVYRKFRFEVGPNGQIVPHPEQRSGNVNLYNRTALVEVEIPADAPVDERLLPMPEAGFFYGIPWTTPEGKAAAAKIPKKGNPYPVMPK